MGAFATEVNVHLQLVKIKDSGKTVAHPFDYTYLFVNGRKSILGYQLGHQRKIELPAKLTVRHFNYCDDCQLKVQIDGQTEYFVEQESDGVTYKFQLN